MPDNTEYSSIISHFIDLIIEANINMPDEEVLEIINSSRDADSKNFLSFIRQERVKLKAELKRTQISWAKKMLNDLIQKAGSVEAFIKTLPLKNQNEPVAQLFRKYESMSDSDKESMLKNNLLHEFLQQYGDTLEIDTDDKS